ncbi:MAG: flagellar basal body rod protein FlgC [bacterium]
MGLFGTLNISASGMTAQRMRMDVIADNIANANTTRTPQGGPFRRHLAVFAERVDSPIGSRSAKANNWNSALMPYDGVRVVGVTEDSSPFKTVHDPGHPDADENGNVMYPNVDPITEMVDLIEANRAYEANLSTFETNKQLFMRTLTMGR